jgi:hypothetical protein
MANAVYNFEAAAFQLSCERATGKPTEKTRQKAVQERRPSFPWKISRCQNRCDASSKRQRWTRYSHSGPGIHPKVDISLNESSPDAR